MMPKNLLRGLNPHRVAMLACTLLLALVSPLNDGLTYVRDWRIVTSVVAPALMVIMIFVLLLDFTMTRIFAIDASPAQRADLLRPVGAVGAVGGVDAVHRQPARLFVVPMI